MSGVIRYSEEEGWIVSSWAFDYVIDAFHESSAAAAAPGLAAEVERIKKGALRYIDLAKFPTDEVEVLRKTCVEVIRRYETGTDPYQPAGGIPDFVERFRELLRMLDLRATQSPPPG